jgi:hypothetical protein
MALAGNLPTATMSDGHAYVTTPSGEMQVISIKNGGVEFAPEFIDLTFNGYADLLILRDKGANQEFYDVYLYSKEKDQYIYNKQFSNIPCLTVDLDKKQLVGQCFHESACENWEGRYSVSPKGNISLVERKGTYCDPTSGQGYTYIDHFKNGKRTSSRTSPVDN